ncbi:MAG: inositol monophosphatase family protein [Anaerorhabdus sp.]|uniref:Fructose-bisphosphatase n=1 Tax=bioreactor metagenome TaxID=1076179 RepID=A0A645FUV1_9ZZZZ|nr:inositol monophosphatase family protein [Anaerorhabdus sp.]MEA4875194.1 inositol monophosphatase family protein [Anaerorhabdus sp.]
MATMEMNQKLDLIFKKFETAKKVVLKAGENVKEKVLIQVDLKDNDISDLVTNCDVECQTMIIEEIKKEYSDDSWLSEENVKDIHSSNLWILDPIDGTTNFVMMKKNYAISLAYYHEGIPMFGLVYDVESDVLYHCIKDQGAFKNDLRLNRLKEHKLSESILDGSLKSLLSFQQAHELNLKVLTRKIRGHRSFGCSSLTICHIAENEKQLFVSNHVKLWDYAAARIVLEEVGGCIETLTSLAKMDENQTCIAASSKNLLDEFKQELVRWN